MKTRQALMVFAIQAVLVSPLLGQNTQVSSVDPTTVIDYQIARQVREIRAQALALRAVAMPLGQPAPLDDVLTDLEKADSWRRAATEGRSVRTEAQIHFFLYFLRSELTTIEKSLGLAPRTQRRAPVDGTVSGTVTGSDLAPPAGIEGVWVEFFDTNNAWVDAVQTDINGDYVSTSLAAGTYFAKTLNFESYVDELYDDIPCHNICDMAGEGDPITIIGTPVTGVDFELDPGGTLSGTITDADGGAPLENITVDLFDTTGEWVSNTGTQVDGTYISLGLPAGSYYARTHNEDHYLNELYNDIACPFYCDPVTSGGTLIAVTVDSDNSGNDFELALGGWISGNTTETGASAIAGVAVEVFDASGNGAGWGVTDGSGDYESNTGLPTGTYFAKTLAPSPFLDEIYDDIYCASWCDVTTGTEIPVVEGVEKPGIDFLLKRGGMISGSVTDTSTTNGIANLWVEFFDDPGGIHVGSALTDITGQYVSQPFPAGTYYAKTWNDLDYLNELFQERPCPFGCDVTDGTPIPVTANTTVLFIDFTLDAGATIAGTVTDGSVAIHGAFVGLYDLNGDWLSTSNTDELGHYTTSAVPAGTYYAKTRNDLGFLDEIYDDLPCPNWCDVTTGTAIVVAAGDRITGIDFDLVAGGLVSGTVTEDPSGPTIEDVNVDIFDSTGNHVSHATTDVDGDYVSFYALVPGTHYARTSNGLGYIDELYDDIPCPSCDVTLGTAFEVAAGSTTSDIDFALADGGWISGTVTEAGTGSPVQNVHVDIFDAQGEFQTFGPTDASGNYAVYNALPPGSYYARAWAEDPPHLAELHDDIPCHFGCDVTGGTPIAVAVGAATDIDFELSVGGFIAGTVTAVGGTPIEGVHVNIHNTSGVLLTWEATDAAGEFTTTMALPTGSYFVNTSSFGGYIHEVYDDMECLGCDVTLGAVVNVGGGSTTTGIDFELAPGGLISGSLTEEGTGTEIPRIRVNIHAADGTFLQGFLPDANGHYVTPNALPTGDYFAATSTMWGVGPRYVNELYGGLPCLGQCDVTLGTSIHVISGSTTTGIDFQLALGGQISGTVLEAGTNAPIDDSTVMLFDSTGRLMTSGRVNAAGEYTSSTAVPTGTYYASTTNAAGYVDELYSETACPGGGDFCPVTSGTAIGITAGQVTENIQFTLARSGGWFEGSVTDEVWGHGLRGVDIAIYNATGILVTRVAWPPPSPTDGSFKTCGLPAGSYFGLADTSTLKQDYPDELFNGIPCPVACDPTDGTPIPVLEGQGTLNIDFTLLLSLFADGFESGDSDAWSSAIP